MTRRARVALISSGAFLVLILIATIAVILVARGGWMRERVRQRIISEAEEVTGARVEIGSFRFHWRSLTAEVDNLAIHGTEPLAEPPLLAVNRVVIVLKYTSLLAQDSFSIRHIEADRPRVHLIVHPDGSTNIPQPKLREAAARRAEAILDLKIGSFDLSNGTILTESPKGEPHTMSWTVRGENLATQVAYNPAAARYDASISVSPLNMAWNEYGPVRARIRATASLEKTLLAFPTVRIETAKSTIDLSNGSLGPFVAPAITAQYKARISLDEADNIFKLVNFRHTGIVNVAGSIHYVSAADYRLSGDVRGSGVGYGNVRDLNVDAAFEANPGRISVSNLLAKALGGEMRATGEVRNFKTFRLAGRLDNFDARKLAVTLEKPPLPYDGTISGTFDANGTLSEREFHRLIVDAKLGVSPVANSLPVHGEVTAHFDGRQGSIELAASWFELPGSRLEVTGIPGERLDVKLQSKNLAALQPALQFAGFSSLPGESASFDGSVTGPLAAPRVAGHIELRDANYRQQKIDLFAGDLVATKTTVTFSNAVLGMGALRIRTAGNPGVKIDLINGKPADSSEIAANVQIANADTRKLMALAGKNVNMTGTLSATAHITGTLADPHATADLSLSKGEIYGEPFDSISGNAQYLNTGVQLLTAAVVAGAKRITASVRIDRAPGLPDRRTLTFHAASNAMNLSKIALFQHRQPDIGGTVQITADGGLELDRGAGGTHAELRSLNADVNAASLTLGTRNFGNAHFTADTRNGILQVRFDSNAVNAAIRGEGTVELAGDYPLNARLTFSNAGLNAIAAVLSSAERRSHLNFDGTAAGDVTITGSARSTDLLNASFDITQLEFHPLVGSGEPRAIQNLHLRNQDPVRLILAKSMIRVESAHFVAPDTNIDIAGSIALSARAPLDLRVRGNVNLALAQSFGAGLTSAGDMVVNGTIKGGWSNPDFEGRAELRKADFHYPGFANGLTNANGSILFNGSRATIQALTAETGGGKVEANGSVALSPDLPFQIVAKARAVRVRYPEGVSSVSDADLTLAGTLQRSEVSGRITVQRVAINPKSDAAGILESTVEPARATASATGIESGINLDVAVETAPGAAVQSSVAQSIEADANLRLRGTVSSPALLGRININHGELVFFGNKYTINQGSISFLNPARIDPILNIDLETKARGVDVILTVTGPVNKMNVSYRSDPPLQFADIIALLATGRTPTDPTLAVRDTGQSQNLEQMGASALIGQAIENPVSGRLQRFFGVSKIKIDPLLTGITGSPEARVTIEQQISPDLLFTYVSDVASTSTQLIQVEWDFNRRWSAILVREANGYVGFDFAFRKRFR